MTSQQRLNKEQSRDAREPSTPSRGWLPSSIVGGEPAYAPVPCSSSAHRSRITNDYTNDEAFADNDIRVDANEDADRERDTGMKESKVEIQAS
jgi:hypothetical protein